MMKKKQPHRFTKSPTEAEVLSPATVKEAGLTSQQPAALKGVRQVSFFDEPDILSMDPGFDKDEDREYRWLRKDSSLRRKQHQGWQPEPDHPDVHYDLLLHSRPKEVAEEEADRIEALTARREQSTASAQFTKDAEIAARQLGVDPARIIFGDSRLKPAGRNNEGGRKFYSTPS